VNEGQRGFVWDRRRCDLSGAGLVIVEREDNEGSVMRPKAPPGELPRNMEYARVRSAAESAV
jgi:hypothetical protein